MAWSELTSMLREAAADDDTARNTPPTACPNDGEPLEAGPGGRLHCRFCGLTA